MQIYTVTYEIDGDNGFKGLTLTRHGVIGGASQMMFSSDYDRNTFVDWAERTPGVRITSMSEGELLNGAEAIRAASAKMKSATTAKI